ncbi:MAG: undecaprenyl/decaprenyl-phosphate alpha-N-acetylglucosaminyl 1-phosphate transferase [Planctomycetes bacterium]|nr:undecaprenyl/decaprenyl-phosphate alpha-N-acetylglucosaminyl 1-phosphate transferase [Planctomycetota bacterium]
MLELAAYLFLVCLLGMGIMTPAAIRLGRSLGILDHPGERKVHSEPVPLSGGWALFAVLSIVLWGHLGVALLLRGTAISSRLPEWVFYFVLRAPELAAKILPVYLGAAAIFVLGLVDDIRGMSVRSRFVFQLGIAGGLVAVGVRPNLEFLPAWMAAGVGILWIVGVTNAFNFLDGLDGLSTGVALVATMALLTIMGISQQPNVVFFLAAMAGTQLGFLRHNFHPAKIFLGSSGSLLLGYLMGVFTVVVTYFHGNYGNWMIPLLTPVFVLAIPLYDTTSVVLIRLLQRRPVAIGDQSHFHHRLMRLGFSHRQTVSFILLIAFSVALSGVRLVNSSLTQSILILIQIVGIMAILIIAERVGSRIRKDVVRPAPPPGADEEAADAESVGDRIVR